MTHLETVSVDRHAHHNVPAVIEAFTPEELEVIQKGKSAQEVLDGGIFRLLEIYDAIMILKRRASTKFAFTDLLRRHGFKRYVGKNGRAPLCNLLKVGDARERVLEWWSTLPPDKRYRWLGPATIIARCPGLTRRPYKQKTPLQRILWELPKLTRDELAAVGRAVLKAHRNVSI
jgi:hypothetical protein